MSPSVKSNRRRDRAEAAAPKAAAPKPSPGRRSGRLSDADLLSMYRFMVQMREFEDVILHIYTQGKFVGGAYSGRGNEATAVATAFALGEGDSIFPMHRDLAAHFVRGQSVAAMMRQYLARRGSLTQGRDGTGHYTDPKLRIYGNISHLGAMVPVACGIALAHKIRKEPNVSLTYIGDGGSNIGEVHEALAMASAMALPFVLVIENNHYAYSTPIDKQFIVERLSTRAAGYGIPGVTVDGTDLLEVYRVCREAVERARAGKGPTIVESVTMRMQGHAAHDTAWYVPKRQLEEWAKKDPVLRFEAVLAKKGLLTPGSKKKLVAGVRAEIEAAAEEALALPYPPGEEALRGVYAERGEA